MRYVQAIHIYLIHALAVVTAFEMTGVLTTTPEMNFNLMSVYIIWLLMIVLLYPICRWFAHLKETGSSWLWAYF
jgi:hypothetical protein